MNRTDRLFALLLELHGDRWTGAERLARHFEVSVRTIYRDVRALGEAGVPVVSLPGKGFRLLEGYLLAPLHFTPQEAFLLSLGAEQVRELFDDEYAQAADSALKKLWATLPAGLGQDLTQLRDHLRVLPADQGSEDGLLRSLRGAVLARRMVSFTYHKPGASPETRRVYPLRLIHLYGFWVLGAHDPSRAGRRTFRLSRMDDLSVLESTFPLAEVGDALADLEWERRDVTVRLWFPRTVRRALRERASTFQTAERELGEGVEVTLQVYDLQDVLPWVLSWGAAVRVLEPATLDERIREEARQRLAESS